ncbi:MAG: S8 family serine peptidase [Planctomycetota bacterium]
MFSGVLRLKLLLVLFVASVPVGPALGADDLEPRPRVIKPLHTEVNDRHLHDVITVKFRDGLMVRLRGGALTDLGTGGLAEAAAALAAVEAGVWQRSYRLPEERLAALRETAQRNLKRAVGDLNLRYNLFLWPGADAAAVIDAFNALDCVEIALPIPRPAPPPVPPDFQPNQVYEDAGPAGVGAELVWTDHGIAGAGVKIVDVEYDWNLDHLDLPPTTILGFDPISPFDDNNHGTAVLGEVGSIDNGWGTTGIAYDAQFYVAGTWDGDVWDVGGAIITALGTIGAGDIVIIEQQLTGPNGEGAYVPVEWYLPWYNDIVTAVGNGVIVVEAAGNGAQNLDDPVYSTGNGGHWPFLPQNDSGAIIVGAGAAPPPFGSDVAGSRLWFSNYGSTVDLQGWGQGVWTTGYGNAWSSEGVNLWYTSSFGGTSSASPIVAGACALLQSAYKDATGSVLSPVEVKELLQETGWPQTSGTYPASQNIGPRCDAHAAIEVALCTPSDQLVLDSPDVAAGDEFGHSVAMSGEVAVIGVVSDDDNGDDSGSAYVFRFDGSNWEQEQKLLPDDGGAGNEFGHAVAISGEVAVVGARSDDDNGDASGSAYVFRFDGSTWLQEQKLLPDDGSPGDEFGVSVALEGDVALIGARKHDHSGTAAGSAYAFRFDGSTWAQEQELLADDGEASDFFGFAVDVSGDTALIGASGDDDNGSGAGSAYVFGFNGSIWTQEQKLAPDDGDGGDSFGRAVGLSGETAVVGVYRDEDNGGLSGSAYVFGFDGSSWLEESKLLPADGTAGDSFGYAVDVSGETVVVGAFKDDDLGSNSGSAYVFGFDGSNWVEERKLRADDGAADDSFGNAVAVSGGTAVIGAFRADQNGPISGAAYVFPDRPPDDCNGNGVADECDIADGTSEDVNTNGIPDECECPWDLDGSGSVDISDLLDLLAAWGTDPGGPPDFNGDGTVGIADLLELLANWGACV